MRRNETIKPVKLSVVAPCYNEEEVLPEFYERTSKVCTQTSPDDYEIVLVNDGSADSTWAIIQSLAQRDPHVVGVNLSRNFGHQAALTAGLEVCQGERVLIIDADLQDPPELLPQMMVHLDDNLDVVYGQRTERQGESPFKKLSALAFYRLLNRIIDIQVPVDTGDFRLVRRNVVEALLSMPENYRFIRGMVAWMGFRQEAFPYRREPRYAGTTKYPLRKMIRFSVDAITGFSILPLRLAFHLASLTLLGSAALALYIFWSWLTQDVVHGWTSVMLSILLFGSAQLVILGVIGEYVGRTYMQAKGRPLYFIRDITVGPNFKADQRK